MYSVSITGDTMAESDEAKLEGSVGSNSVLQDAVTAFMAGEVELDAVRVALASVSLGTTNTMAVQQPLVCTLSNNKSWERCRQLHDASFAAVLFPRLNVVGASSLHACIQMLAQIAHGAL